MRMPMGSLSPSQPLAVASHWEWHNVKSINQCARWRPLNTHIQEERKILPKLNGSGGLIGLVFVLAHSQLDKIFASHKSLLLPDSVIGFYRTAMSRYVRSVCTCVCVSVCPSVSLYVSMVVDKENTRKHFSFNQNKNHNIGQELPPE